MREMLAPTAALVGAELGDSVGLVTDGRFRAGRMGSSWVTSFRKPASADRSRS